MHKLQKKLYLTKHNLNLFLISAVSCISYNSIARSISCSSLVTSASASNGTDLKDWTDGHWLDILVTFCDAVQKWIFLFIIVSCALWGFTHNQKRKEMFWEATKNATVVFLICSIPTTFYDLLLGIVNLFR